MLKIKLARFGKNKQPEYRIVVNEGRDKRDGKYVALLGHYAPTRTPKVLTIDVAEFENWLKKGAQPTETVAALFTRFQSGTPFPQRAPQLSKKAKAKLAAEKEAAEAAKQAATEAAAAPAPEATEVPAESSAATAETTEATEQTSQPAA
jgi:small subunit ribosomal protein S16